MKHPPRTMVVVIAAASWFSVAVGDDYPFSSIAKLPERKLIGVDQYGNPHIADKDKKEVALIAISPQSPPELRSLATLGLAISGYSPESADALIKAVADATLGNRHTAAMGLRNFTTELPVDKKEDFRVNLREIVKSEGFRVPNEIFRTMIAWDDASWLVEQFGNDLVGHALEIEIIQKLPAAKATPRLLEIYRTTRRDNSADSYNRRAAIGRALANYQDKRGIDILDTLLDAASVPTLGDAPNHQYRQNVMAFIQRAVGNKFDYVHRNYDPSIDEAILRFREWWLQERYHYQFDFPAK